MAIDILIILNNFIHDLAAAMWFCGTLIIFIMVREGTKRDHVEINNFIKKVYKKLLLITRISLIVVILGGVIRAFTYHKYEWAAALGKNQVDLLIIKHLLFGFIVIAGIYIQIRLSRKVKEIKMMR